MTTEEQISAAIEAFFANREHTEQEKAMVTEMIMGCDVVINEKGELVLNNQIPTKRYLEKIYTPLIQEIPMYDTTKTEAKRIGNNKKHKKRKKK